MDGGFPGGSLGIPLGFLRVLSGFLGGSGVASPTI